MTNPGIPSGPQHTPTEDGGGVLFPVNFTAYRDPGQPDLETENHVRAVADLLAPYGLRLSPWDTPPEERHRQAVDDWLETWAGQTGPPPGGNTVLYWVGHGKSDALAHAHTRALDGSGVSAHDVARAIGRRQVHPGTEQSWAIVVLDTCFSHDFAVAVQIELLTRYPDAARYLLLSTAARGYAELGAFTRALHRALTVTFLGQRTIGLATLGIELQQDLGGHRSDTAADHRDQLVNRTADIATAVSAPLDQLAELQAVIDQLPDDEKHHFVPKAGGAELGVPGGGVIGGDRLDEHWAAGGVDPDADPRGVAARHGDRHAGNGEFVREAVPQGGGQVIPVACGHPSILLAGAAGVGCE